MDVFRARGIQVYLARYLARTFKILASEPNGSRVLAVCGDLLKLPLRVRRHSEVVADNIPANHTSN